MESGYISSLRGWGRIIPQPDANPFKSVLLKPPTRFFFLLSSNYPTYKETMESCFSLNIFNTWGWFLFRFIYFNPLSRINWFLLNYCWLPKKIKLKGIPFFEVILKLCVNLNWSRFGLNFFKSPKHTKLS